MKKVLVFVLVLALLPFGLALAVDESQYVGTWIQEVPEDETGYYRVALLRLTADHQAYYAVQSFNPGEPGINRQSAKTWFVKGNGIHIILGENTETDAIILDDGRLGFKLSGNAYSPYVKFIDPFSVSEDEADSGVYVPGGYWTVGVDIPAGAYSVRLPKGGASQNFAVFDKYNEDTGLYTRVVVNIIIDKNSPLLGKLELREGNVVHVFDGVYFDAPVALGFK